MHTIIEKYGIFILKRLVIVLVKRTLQIQKLIKHIVLKDYFIWGRNNMNNKSTPSKADVVKIDSKDIEVLGTKGSLNSVGKEIVVTIVAEGSKALIPIALEGIKEKIKLDQETQKLVRDDKRKILNDRAEMLIKQIEKEEDKADYNQERINRWCEELEEIMRKLDIMSEKSEGFIKGMVFPFIKFINSKLK